MRSCDVKLIISICKPNDTGLPIYLRCMTSVEIDQTNVNINRGTQNVTCVNAWWCLRVISAGPQGLFSGMLAVDIVLMMVC